MASVTLVNYGVGNIRAFANIYQRLNISVDVATTPKQLVTAERIVLPGVGAFDWAITLLNKSGLRDTLDTLVLRQRVPVLGVCVGMQMMANFSEEGKLPGLGWIDANVVRFQNDLIQNMPLPHMGWNDVQPSAIDTLFRGIELPRYYFLHSFFIVPKLQDCVLATTRYGSDFTAAVRKGHIFGTQFHPEKSHQWGIALLRNFAEI